MFGNFAYFGKVAVMRKHKAHIAGGGFHNNGGNGFALSTEHFFQCSFVVKRNGNGVGGNVFRYARAVGDAESCSAAACLNEQAVMMAVVAADEFNNVVASGIGACVPGAVRSWWLRCRCLPCVPCPWKEQGGIRVWQALFRLVSVRRRKNLFRQLFLWLR